MDIYTKVKEKLRESTIYRDSDKELLWRIWQDEGLIYNGAISKENFLKGTPAETITRARRKVVSYYPELAGKKEVEEKRKEKENLKGNFVFKKENLKSYEWYEDALSILRIKWGNIPASERKGEEWEKDLKLAEKWKMERAEVTSLFTEKLFNT